MEDGNSRWVMNGGEEEESRKILWNTEEKVAKVIETGAALGFDYNGQEEEIVEYVTLRKREDEDRVA